MNKFLFLVLLFISTTASSQTTDSTFIKKKHTLGFAGIPLHVLFVGGGSHNQSYNLSYKRQGKKLNFRSSINYLVKPSNFYNQGLTYSLIETTNDSIWNKRTNTERVRNEVDIRVGLEKNWNKKRSTWLFGLDFVAGYYNSEYRVNEYFYPLGTTFSSELPTIIAQGNYLEKRYSALTLGFSPVVGWEYQINKIFGLSVQYRPVINYHTGKSAEEYEREKFVDGVILESPVITNRQLDTSKDNIEFNNTGFDLFLTVNF